MLRIAGQELDPRLIVFDKDGTLVAFDVLWHTRFARLMDRHAGTAVKVRGPMAIGELAASGAKLAVLTGTEKFTLSEAEIKALKTFVEGGGTVFIDAAGGEEPKAGKGFVASVEAVLAAAFPGQRLASLPPTSPLYTRKGMEIRAVRWRRETRVAMLDTKAPHLRAIRVDGRPGVIFSRHDITAGLLGVPVAGIYGYHPGDVKDPGTAFKLMRNIVLTATKGP